MSSKIYDILIIGGGPAGLAAATAAARQVRSTVVFDSGVYRNAQSHHMHNVPTWDHQDPAVFRAKARKDLEARYPLTEFADVEVETIKKTDENGFIATDRKGQEWRGHTVILATGSRDQFPDIEGYSDCWVKGIFHCLFCHGYEERGSDSAGILAVGALAGPQVFGGVMMAAQLAKSLTLYTNGSEDLKAMFEEKVAAFKVPTKLDTRVIRRLVKESEKTKITIHFEDGSSTTESFLVHSPISHLAGPWAEQLGLELVDSPMYPGAQDIKVSPPFNATSVPGVFAAGDCSTAMKMVLTALQSGGMAGGGAVMYLGQRGL